MSLTEKQKKVVQGLLENVGTNKPKSKGQILRESGYGRISLTPERILESPTIQKEIKPVVDQLKAIRQKTLEALSSKELSDEKYHDLVDGLDKITKNIQLLSGEETEKSKVVITWENENSNTL